MELLEMLEDNSDLLQQKHYFRKMLPLSYIDYTKAPVGSLPSNYVAIGDSCMVLNPLFG